MASIQSGKPSWSRWKNRKVRKILISTMLRRRLEKMWRKLLEVCKPNLLLWEDRLDFRIRNALVHHARLCDHAQHDHREWAWPRFRLLTVWALETSRASAAEMVARFVASYHAIRRPVVHDDLWKDLIEEWWAWHGRQRAWFLRSTLYCSWTICCVYCSIYCTER